MFICDLFQNTYFAEKSEIVASECVDVVWTCLDVVWTQFGQCLDAAWTLSGHN